MYPLQSFHRTLTLYLEDNAPLLALISTKNRLKSLEVTINEASKFREIQPFSYFTKDY